MERQTALVCRWDARIAKKRPGIWCLFVARKRSSLKTAAALNHGLAALRLALATYNLAASELEVWHASLAAARALAAPAQEFALAERAAAAALIGNEPAVDAAA